MPGLPSRPDLDQLRRQARELLPRLLPSARVAAQADQVRPVTGNPAERDLARRARLMTAIWLGTCARPAGGRSSCAATATGT